METLSDQAVLCALRSPDGRIRGTFVAAHGPQMAPACAAFVHRLPRAGEPVAAEGA